MLHNSFTMYIYIYVYVYVYVYQYSLQPLCICKLSRSNQIPIKSEDRIATRCSAGVLGVTCATLLFALAFALAFPLAVGSGPGDSVLLATSTKALRVGPLPQGVGAPEEGTSCCTSPANPVADGATRALAVAVTRVRSFSENSPPEVAQNRTLSGHSGASGSGWGVDREMMVSILALSWMGFSEKTKTISHSFRFRTHTQKVSSTYTYRKKCKILTETFRFHFFDGQQFTL